MRAVAVAAALGTFSVATLAAADPGTVATTDASPAADQSYVLGPEDVIEVQVLGRSDFTTRARIGQDGSIQLPYLGTVAAGNRTTNELSSQIGKALEAGGYYASPIVRVEIVSYASRYVTVLGEVGSPGLVPVDRPYHLSELLARVGGVRPDAADFIVLKPANGAEQRLAIKTIATGDAQSDPLIQPGDKIFVDKAELFYISGQVKSPGAYPFDTGMTLRMAIARAGGLTDLGTDHDVKVTEPGGKSVRLRLDDTIQSRDVILVGERLF